ncbi:hypothetical protein V8E53_006788 [Lactarius tabidus]
MPPHRRLGHNTPPDDDNPQTNLPPSFPARFMTVLELYRAQRDTPSQVQAAPPSPTFQVQYQPDAPPVYHTLFAVLSSQAMVVAQEELDTIREAVPLPPDTPTPQVILEAVECVLPVLSNNVVTMSIQAMEQVLAQNSTPDNLELNDVPPEVWAALCTAVPARGSTLNESISCSSSFAKARETVRSNASLPMDDSPTQGGNTPLFLPGSSGEGQLSVSYHPQSIEANSPSPHVIGDQQHPITISSASYGSNREIITWQLEHAPALLEVDINCLTPTFQFPVESHNTALSLRSMIDMQTMDGTLAPLTTANYCYFQAEGALHTIRDELNQAVEGHSHYFLREPLSIMEDPTFLVQLDELRHILDIAGAALSAGPRADNDQDEIWRLLRPSDWYRAATHTMAAILRGAVRTKHVGRAGNFPIEPLRDDYRRSDNPPRVRTQQDLLEAMALQIAEHLTLDNGPYLPQDSINGIRATVWCAHQAQIQAAVAAKANEVKDRLTTMGLSDLIDKLLNEASWEEITDTIKEDIDLQVCSKFNNQCLAEENRAYTSMIEEATKEGKAKAAKEALQTYAATSSKLREQKECQAQKDADSYYLNLVEKAKEQAHIKVDSEFARLVADERSKLAPKVDKEITMEHTKLVEEHCLAMVAQLNALTLEGEKKLVLATAARLGMSIKDEEPAAKKVKVDQRKARPSPVTPRGRSNSIISNASAQALSQKRAYSPSEITAPAPLPDREDQKTPTPKSVTTVAFEIKAEPTPLPTFATPSTPSVIRDAVNITEDVPFNPSTSVRGTASSIHNDTNHMAIDPENLNLAEIFPPGIPPPPANVSLPPAMSRTPTFGGAKAHEDRAAPSCSPEVDSLSISESRMIALMQKFNQPIWDTIHRIEQAIGGNKIPRILQRAGPGTGPVVTTWGTELRKDTMVAPPFPSEPPVPEWSNSMEEQFACVDDDEEFPALEPYPNNKESNEPLLKQGQFKDAGNQETKASENHQRMNPPAVLSGRWSTTSNTTGNFVYTIAGIIPPCDLMALKPYLCQPFKGQTELVPTKGWTWIQLCLVPTEDLDGCVWGPEDLLSQFVANPCFQDVLICIAPHWQGNPLNNDKERSTVLAAIINEDNSMCQNALTHGVCMFGAQVKFLRCRDNPTLLQCSCCHLLGHYTNSSKCKLPKTAVKCYRCNGNHDGRDHDYECNAKTHKAIGKCDCTLKCLLCKKTDHHARSCKCLKRGDFNPPRLPECHKNEPFQMVGKKQVTKGKERAPPYSLPLNSFIVPEVKNIPLPQCPKEVSKNILLCMCCTLLSMTEYQKQFISPRPNVTDTTALLTARIVSSKGKSISKLYSELSKCKEMKRHANPWSKWKHTTTKR